VSWWQKNYSQIGKISTAQLIENTIVAVKTNFPAYSMPIATI
jgi:hypothetical protein